MQIPMPQALKTNPSEPKAARALILTVPIFLFFHLPIDVIEERLVKRVVTLALPGFFLVTLARTGPVADLLATRAQVCAP
jgi:hypothetical protein